MEKKGVSMGRVELKPVLEKLFPKDHLIDAVVAFLLTGYQLEGRGSVFTGARKTDLSSQLTSLIDSPIGWVAAAAKYCLVPPTEIDFLVEDPDSAKRFEDCLSNVVRVDKTCQSIENGLLAAVRFVLSNGGWIDVGIHHNKLGLNERLWCHPFDHWRAATTQIKLDLKGPFFQRPVTTVLPSLGGTVDSSERSLLAILDVCVTGQQNGGCFMVDRSKAASIVDNKTEYIPSLPPKFQRLYLLQALLFEINDNPLCGICPMRPWPLQ